MSTPENSVTAAKPVSMIEALNRALHDAMAADPKVLVLGEEIGDKQEGGIVGVTKGLSTTFGTGRVRATPISEQAIIGAAIGASLKGYRPVAEIMLMNFTTVAMDMIVNHAAKLRYMSGGQTNVPIVIRTMTGAGFGTGGQHSDYYEAWFAHTAGLKVVAPSTPADGYGLMLAAIQDDDPVIFIENMPTYWTPGPAPVAGVPIPLGVARIAREGRDVTVVTYSRMVGETLVAADKLGADGIAVEVIDLRTVAPWDRGAVMASVAKTGRAVIVHEAVRQHGVGAEIAAEIGDVFFGQLKAPVQRLGAHFSPVPFSKPLEISHAPNATDIEACIRTLINRR